MRIVSLFTLSLSLHLWACDKGTADSESRDRSPIVDDAGLGRETASDATVTTPSLLNAVRPALVSTNGGTQVTLIGRELHVVEAIWINDSSCIDWRIINPFRGICIVPSSESSGAATIRIAWADGYEEVHQDMLSYYLPLTVDAVVPSILNASEGGEVQLSGVGFVEDMNVSIGSRRLPTRVEDGTRATIRIPRMDSGIYGLRVSTPQQVLDDAASITLVAPLAISGIHPPIGTVLGGEEVRVVGVGLEMESTVFFGALPAEVLSGHADKTSLVVEAPTAGRLGFVDFRVENLNGSAVVEDGYLYTPLSGQIFSAYGVRPNRLSTVGDNRFWIGGMGFRSDTRVYFDDMIREDCVVETANRILCDLGPQLAGVHTVQVRSVSGEQSEIFEIVYFQEPIVHGITPSRGSIAGGTHVEILGQGFHDGIEVWLDSEEVMLLTISSNRITGLTAPSSEGLADLRIAQDGTSMVNLDAFEYVNFGSPFGGVWGPEIEHNINVAVYDNDSRRPIADARVRVDSMAGDVSWQAFTNERGQVVIADPDLPFPVRVTVGHPEYTSASIDRVVSENVSLLLASKVPPEGDGMMEPEPLVEVRGQVAGIGELDKPTEPGLMVVAVVESSHPFPGGLYANPMPTETSVLIEDGPYQLTTKPGQFAVCVTVGVLPVDVFASFQDGSINYWAMRGELRPQAMGFRPGQVAYPGDRLTNVDLRVDRPRKTSVQATLDNPPAGGGLAPNEYLVRVMLDLGADGYYDLTTEARSETPTMTIVGLPQIADWPETDVRLRWEGEALVAPMEGVVNDRYSWSSVTEDGLSNRVTIGPFLPTTEVTDPPYLGVITPPFRVAWIEHPGWDENRLRESADLHYVTLSNQDGLLWNGWLPGPIHEFFPPLDQPPLSEQLQDFNEYSLSMFSVLANERFSFDDFGFDRLGQLRAYSWSLTRFTDADVFESGDLMPRD